MYMFAAVCIGFFIILHVTDHWYSLSLEDRKRDLITAGILLTAYMKKRTKQCVEWMGYLVGLNSFRIYSIIYFLMLMYLVCQKSTQISW